MLGHDLRLPLSGGEEAWVPERWVVAHKVVDRVVSGSVGATQSQLLRPSLDLT
jgi:hypothetical protein